MIKSRVTRAVGRRYFLRAWLADGGHGDSGGTGQFWARGGWSRRLISAAELSAGVDYLHWNPVHHGHHERYGKLHPYPDD